VTLQAEVFYRRFTAGSLRATDPSAYAQLLWRLSRRLSVAARYEWNGAVVAEAGHLPAALGALDDRDSRRRASAALTFAPSEFSKLRVQLSRTDDPHQERPALAAYLVLELAIGAHGAHPY
jgi:hypothetical protein